MSSLRWTGWVDREEKGSSAEEHNNCPLKIHQRHNKIDNDTDGFRLEK